MTRVLAIILRLDKTSAALSVYGRIRSAYESWEGKLERFTLLSRKYLILFRRRSNGADAFLRAKRNSGINKASFGAYSQCYLLLSPKFLPTLRSRSQRCGRFSDPVRRSDYADRNAKPCDKKRIKYLPLDRTTRLMKIPIVTPLVLYRETFRRDI